MIGQVLSDGGELTRVYTREHGLTTDKGVLQQVTGTWEYTSLFEGKDVEYAKLLTEGESLRSLCPEEIRLDAEFVFKRIDGFANSLKVAKFNDSSLGIADILPEWLLRDFLDIKTRVCEEILTKRPKPGCYEQLYKIHKIIYEMNKNEINGRKIAYNMFGTKTGRLVTEKHSFPVLNLPKGQRKVVESRHGFLLEIDYNAMEPRVLLGLNGVEQPTHDVHSWISNNLFGKSMDRDSSKIELFRWMYGGEVRASSKLDRIFNKEKILSRFYEDGEIKTVYGRTVECERPYLAMSYIIQSTSNDLFFEQIYKVRELLREYKSQLYFCVHDSIVLDMFEDETFLIEQIVNILEDTRFGKFKVQAKTGQNYGELK